MNQVLLAMGLKTDSFEAGSKRVIAQAREIGHEWHGLRKVFEVGGVLTAAKVFFEEIVKGAQDSRKALTDLGRPVPETTRAVAELGDSLKDVGNLLLYIPTKAVAGWALLGESLGYIINRVRGYSEAQQNVIASGEKLVEAAEARLKKSREENSPEKIVAAEKHLAEVREAQAIERATGEQRMALLLAQNLKLHEEIRATGEKSIKGAQLREELEKNLTAITQTEATLRRDEADAAHKTAEERRQQGEEALRWYKEQYHQQEELKKLKLAALSDDKKAAALQKDQHDLTVKIADEKKRGEDTLADEVKLQTVLNELSDVNVKLTEKRTVAEKKILEIKTTQAKMDAASEELRERIYFDTTNGGYSSQQIQGASSDALKEAQRRNNQKLLKIGSDSSITAGVGGGRDLASDFNTLRLQNENRRIQKELDLRNQLRANQSNLGSVGARRAFSGDPLLYDRLNDEFKANKNVADQTLTVLQQLQRRLYGDGSKQPTTSPDIAKILQDGFSRLDQRLNDPRRTS